MRGRLVDGRGDGDVLREADLRALLRARADGLHGEAVAEDCVVARLVQAQPRQP